MFMSSLEQGCEVVCRSVQFVSMVKAVLDH